MTEDVRPMTHNWSGWPGAWCLNCGCEDPLEAALGCQECDLVWPGDSNNKVPTRCPSHQDTDCPGPKNGANPYVNE